MAMTNNDAEDLLDLNLSHETDTTQTTNNQTGSFPAFQSIDGGTSPYATNNAYDENAPMLGQGM